MAKDVYAKYEHLDIERQGDGVVLITLNRPEKLNAMTYAMHGELARVWGDVAKDPGTKVAVVTAPGAPSARATTSTTRTRICRWCARSSTTP